MILNESVYKQMILNECLYKQMILKCVQTNKQILNESV